MTEISFAHVLTLAGLEQPRNHSLDEDCKLIAKRSKICNFFHWVIYLITLGQVSRNGSLDKAALKIVQATRTALSQETWTQNRKDMTLKALRNAIQIIDQNSGSKRKMVEELVNQVSQKAIVPSAPLSGLEAEIVEGFPLDTVLGPPQSGDWRAGPGRTETEQTFETFKTFQGIDTLKARRTLHIYQIGQFTEKERKILRIVGDYLTAVHGVNVSLVEPSVTIEDLKNRHIEWLMHEPHGRNPQAVRREIEAHYASPQFVRGGQYNYANLVTMLQHLHQDNSNALGFISADLFYPGYNFVFGAANFGGNRGLFSIHRMGNANGSESDFKRCLQNLMMLAHHEFGHMRGLEHCTTHRCNMQGINSINEMRKLPMTFCAKDTAKICHLNGWTLKQGYQSQLSFFENFTQKYGIQMDFDADIMNLRARIQVLSA